MTEFLEVFGLVLLAGLLAVIALIVFDAWHRRRHPEFGQLPAISAAMEHDLLGRDNDTTRAIAIGKSYVSGRPMHAIEAPCAIEASRSQS